MSKMSTAARVTKQEQLVFRLNHQMTKAKLKLNAFHLTLEIEHHKKSLKSAMRKRDTLRKKVVAQSKILKRI